MRHSPGFAALLAVAVACCSEAEITAEQAPGHFARNRPAYERIVALVDACRPARPATSYSMVWANGAGQDQLRCARPGGDLTALVSALNDTDVVAVDYGDDGDSANPLQAVSIIVSARGLGVSGTLTAFAFESQATSERMHIERRENGSVLSERRAVTEPPYHWFWEHTT